MDDMSESRVIDPFSGQDSVIIAPLVPSRIVARHPGGGLRLRRRREETGNGRASKNEHNFFPTSNDAEIHLPRLQFPCHVEESMEIQNNRQRPCFIQARYPGHVPPRVLSKSVERC